MDTGGAVAESHHRTTNGKAGDGKQSATPANKKFLNWPTLLISNLNPVVTDLDIYDLFQEFGNLKRANVHHDKYGHSLQTADVVFFSEDDARRALKEYDNTPLDGYVMRIFLCNSFSAGSGSTTTTTPSGSVSSSRTSQVAAEDGEGKSSYSSSRHSKNNNNNNNINNNNNNNNNNNINNNDDSSYRQGGRKSGSKSENAALFQVNDIPRMDSNKHFFNNFSDELKNQSSKPRIPVRQGKWWHQQSRDRRSDY